MIHAYSEIYLNDAMNNLGEAFDYAINACDINMDEFVDLFISSGLASEFEKGNPRVVSGLSGTELVMEITAKSKKNIVFKKAQVEYDYSLEYWCGYILAYYQWYTNRTFKNIKEYISMKEIQKLYSTLHEASDEKAIDTIDAIISRNNNTSRLQIFRKNCGYSQRQLAEKSGVNLRTLQQYELKSKDINNASFKTVMSLARTLGCRIEDLLEYQ